MAAHAIPQELLQTWATQAGLDAVGIAAAAPPTHGDFFVNWLANGKHGEMHYLQKHAAQRLDPQKLLPGARSFICFAWNYRPPQEPRATGLKVARYALGRDYHNHYKARLKHFWELLTAHLGTQLAGQKPRARFFTDSAPVLERDYAAAAGVGWIGKNCCLIHPKLGSWLFLGEILTDLELQISRPMAQHCGTCTACLEACPTGALTAPYELDSNLCIAYLTIEKRGELTPREQKLLGEHLFGCDICQEVCPWNRRAPLGNFYETGLRPELIAPEATQLHCADDTEFADRFQDSPIERTGFNGWQRNLNIVKKNSAPHSN